VLAKWDHPSLPLSLPITVQEHQVSIGDLAVAFVANDIASTPAFNSLASFRTATPPLGLSCAPVVGTVVLACAFQDGCLARLRMNMPAVPGALPDTVQLCEGDFSGPELLPWAQVHNGPATALDINPGD